MQVDAKACSRSMESNAGCRGLHAERMGCLGDGNTLQHREDEQGGIDGREFAE